MEEGTEIGLKEVIQAFQKSKMLPPIIGKTRNGIYMTRIGWKDERACYGERYVWMYYSKKPRVLKSLYNLFDRRLSEFANMGGCVVLIDDFDPNDPIIEVVMMIGSDGCSLAPIMTWSDDGGKGKAYTFSISQGKRFKEEELSAITKLVIGETIAGAIKTSDCFLINCHEATIKIGKYVEEIVRRESEEKELKREKTPPISPLSPKEVSKGGDP